MRRYTRYPKKKVWRRPLSRLSPDFIKAVCCYGGYDTIEVLRRYEFTRSLKPAIGWKALRKGKSELHN